MKLKDENNLLESVLLSSLTQLSKEYTKQVNQTGVTYIFDYYNQDNILDNDKNICYSGIVDVRAEGPDGKVLSYKNLYDKWQVRRENTGTVEEPTYGKQQNIEEARNRVLKQIIGQGIAGLALGLASRTKDEIEEFNKVTEEPLTEEEEVKGLTQEVYKD